MRVKVKNDEDMGSESKAKNDEDMGDKSKGKE